MKCKIEIQMDNAAFTEYYGQASEEVSSILKDLSKRIFHHPHFSPGHNQPLYDINGNHVGYIDVYK